MLKTTRWIIFLMMVLGMMSLACQTIMGPDEEETSNSTETPAENTAESVAEENAAASENNSGNTTEQPTTTDIAEAESTGQTFNFRRANAALDEVNSYRATILMSSTSGADAAEAFSMELEMLVTTNPPATSFRLLGLDAGLGDESVDLGGLGEMTVVQVDGKTYTLLAGLGCTTSDGTDTTTTEGFITRPDALFEDIDAGAVTLVEEGVEVNWIRTNHYQFDQSAIPDSDVADGTLTGDMYVAQDGEFIVRFVIDGQGSSLNFGDDTTTDTGTFHLEFNVLDVNSDIAITAPAECTIGGDSGGTEGGSEAGSYPMLADAFDMTNFSGFISYKTNTSVPDAAAFYRDELVAQGWTISFEYSDDTTATITLTREGKNLTIAITADPTSGANLVSIIES